MNFWVVDEFLPSQKKMPLIKVKLPLKNMRVFKTNRGGWWCEYGKLWQNVIRNFKKAHKTNKSVYSNKSMYGGKIRVKE